MKWDEFSFFNAQLAGMLKQDIPLEAGIQRLCDGMRQGRLRAELELTRRDLSEGVPLVDALKKRRLPDLYVRMVHAGVESQNLPGILILLADYYHRANLLWTRLKGLMVYPLILLAMTAAFSVWVALAIQPAFAGWRGPGAMASPIYQPAPWPTAFRAYARLHLWLPPLVFVALTGIGGCVLSWPRLRRNLEWRLPGFREARLAEFASSMELMLRGGCALPSSLALLARLEEGTVAGRDLESWRQRCADGHVRWLEITRGSRCFPPLFGWLVDSAREDLSDGFHRAAALYQERARYRSDVLLYASLPVALVFIGLMIVGQILPLWIYVYDFGTFFHETSLLPRLF